MPGRPALSAGWRNPLVRHARIILLAMIGKAGCNQLVQHIQRVAWPSFDLVRRGLPVICGVRETRFRQYPFCIP
jgi:hypothetical protein